MAKYGQKLEEVAKRGKRLWKVTKLMREKNLWAILKAITGILCMVGFVGNSYIIFDHFIGHNTITSQNQKKYEKIALPSVTICSPSGFKKVMDEPGDLELDSYLNSTIDLDEVLLDVADSGGFYYLEEIYKNPTIWKITTTYSSFKGRCHTIQYKKEVKH